MNVTTKQAIQQVIDGSFAGGVIVGNLENGGVGLAPFHDLESLISADLQAELTQLMADIIAGTVPTTPAPAK
jgi:basic membrane protein A